MHTGIILQREKREKKLLLLHHDMHAHHQQNIFIGLFRQSMNPESLDCNSFRICALYDELYTDCNFIEFRLVDRSFNSFRLFESPITTVQIFCHHQVCLANLQQ